MDFRLNKGFRLKGQVALEFVLLIGLAFMIMIVFSALAQDSLVGLRQKEEYIALKDLMHTMQGEIITANIVENGYKRIFTIPQTLDGVTYTMYLLNGYIIGESTNQEYALKVAEVNGSFVKGGNTIRKQGGVVYLN